MGKRKKELKNLCSKVFKDFSKIKKRKIKADYAPKDEELICINIEYAQRFLSKKQKIRSSTIITGYIFFMFDDETKKALIAHELGHYVRSLGYTNPEGMKRRLKWHKEAEKYEKLCGNKWLQKWLMLLEIYADSQAAKSGYGKPFLNFLKGVYAKENFEEIARNPHKGLIEIYKKELKARIENLEKILGE